MINDFDKEIDSLLRQRAVADEAAYNGKNVSFAAVAELRHPDADEISLFAEKALPVKARLRLTEHLADCDRCRKILSSLITLDSETLSENLHAKEIIAPLVARLPWYKKLFSFPQIAYAMGALALIFSGVIALTILQNAGESLESSVAQNEPMPAASDENTGAQPTPGMFSTSNTTTATTANTTVSNTATSTANTAANSAVRPSQAPLSSNSNSSIIVLEDKPAEAQPEAVEQERKNVTLDGVDAAKPASPVKKEANVKGGPYRARNTNDYAIEREEAAALAKRGAEVAKTAPVEGKAGMAPPSGTPKPRVSQPAARAQNPKDAAAETDDRADRDKSAKNKSADTTTSDNRSGETISAGGKVFRRASGVWYDPAYRGGATVNVRRGSAEYKRLDAGLRSIAEKISGTVVVVWKGKAYRIQ